MNTPSPETEQYIKSKEPSEALLRRAKELYEELTTESNILESPHGIIDSILNIARFMREF